MHELLIFADRQKITAAGVEHVANIEVCQSPVKRRTKARYRRCTIAALAAAIQLIGGIPERLRVRVSNEVGNVMRELLFEFGLQAVVNASPWGMA